MLKNFSSCMKISSCLFDMTASFCFEKNKNISCHNLHFVQRPCFMHWCFFIIFWFIQRISDRIISVFVLRLFRLFFSHQHDQISTWWFVRMCCHINNRFHMILISFFIMSSCVNVFDSIFRLTKISFMISIVSRSVSFNFSINSFSNSYNCFWNSSLHSYSLFNFDRFLYEYDVFNLLKARRIASFIFCVFVNALSDAVLFRTFCNLLTFSIW